jgi:hypothetical protein
MTGIGAVSASGSTARGGSITAVVSVLGGRPDRCAAPDARRPSEDRDACSWGAVASSGCAAGCAVGSSRGGRGDRRAAMRAAALS